MLDLTLLRNKKHVLPTIWQVSEHLTLAGKGGG